MKWAANSAAARCTPRREVRLLRDTQYAHDDRPVVQDLGGIWQLAHFADGEGEDAAQGVTDEADWIAATVPGDIHLDLLAAGRVPDPFIEDNYKHSLFAEEREWWYVREFTPEADMLACRRVEILFEGLDTFATVYLNGVEIGTSRNMWVPLTADVTDLLQPLGANTLAVRLRSPSAAVREDMERDETPHVTAGFTPRERVYARKAQMSFGWDIAPRLVTCGIWRPVRLIGHGAGAIRDVHVRSRLNEDGSATVALTALAEPFVREGDFAILFRARCGDSAFEASASLQREGGPLSGSCEVRVPGPKLWWTWDTGEPNLYDLEATLLCDGTPVARWAGRFGIRDIELRLADPASGEPRFSFILNGRDTFMRGTNWIPVDAIFARVTRERLAEVLGLARELNCNMLRVWGGGIYEAPAFYDLCDELGILVWQDFMFACAIYPQNDGFLTQVFEEAESVVRALRNHPCLAIWSGDNECDCSYRGLVGGEAYHSNRITRGVLPAVVSSLDPDRPYVPSSPSNPSGAGDPNGDAEGDTHIWSHNEHPRAPMYFADRSKFISEIGRISPATLGTIRRFLRPEHQWPNANPVWDQHLGTLPTCDFHRRDRMDEAIERILGAKPQTLEDYVEASHLLQAWCLSEWIERARRRKFECGGILWWNLFDNWPQHSDAVVDHYFGVKPAFHAVKRSSRLVLPSIAPEADGWSLWVVNDLDEPCSVEIELAAASVQGSSRTLLTTEAVCPANSSAMVAQVTSDAAGKLDPDSDYLVVTMRGGGAEPVMGYHVLNGCKSIAVLRSIYGSAT